MANYKKKLNCDGFILPDYQTISSKEDLELAEASQILREESLPKFIELLENLEEFPHDGKNISRVIKKNIKNI